MAWIGLGQRFLNVTHPLLKCAAATSYPLYLLHPLVMLPGLLLVAQWPVNTLGGFSMVTALVLAGTLVLTALLKRLRFACLLRGLKGEPGRDRSFAPSAGIWTMAMHPAATLDAPLE